MSDSRPQARQNTNDNVFAGVPAGTEEHALFVRFLDSHDFSANTRRAMTQDIRKFATWFSAVNAEPFVVGRVTIRDITDFKHSMRHDQRQAVSTVNRALVTLRRYFGWLVDVDHLTANPAKPVKELRRVELAPKGMDRADVRRLLREIEFRQDVRFGAIISLFLYTGCRLGDLVNLELGDVMVTERGGTVVFRHGKGNKQRSVPLPLPARRAIQAYLESRPPSQSSKVFIGERGPLTDNGVRTLFDKYSVIIGIKVHPHLLRHTMAKQFLADTDNDLVGLAQILGHSSLTTTARYTRRSTEALAEAAEKMNY